MKRIIMMATVALLSVGAFAQGGYSGKTKQKSAKKMAVEKDGFKKVNGHMLVVTNGTAEIMIKAQTLANGTIVLPNGALKTSTGETALLESGDFLDLEGNLTTKDKSKKEWIAPVEQPKAVVEQPKAVRDSTIQ
ncbi:MAG: DUF6799 domain-containing protein [Bacteroidota bacterium]